MIKSACRLRRCERGSCSVPVKIQLAIGHPEKTGMKAGLATQKPDDSISRSRLMLFLSEVSEPAEGSTIPEKLQPAIMKGMLQVRLPPDLIWNPVAEQAFGFWSHGRIRDNDGSRPSNSRQPSRPLRRPVRSQKVREKARLSTQLRRPSQLCP